MKVSIIVPVYNVEEYIKRCFESVINQTYPYIECIFVDDCTPDNCNQIITDMIDRYSGDKELSIIKHKKNKGLSGARNTGTHAATGEYIYYLDSDDDIPSDSIEKLVGVVKKHPGVDIVQGNTETIPMSDKSDWRDIRKLNFPDYSTDTLWIKERCLVAPRIPVNAWNKLIRLDFIKENSLYNREGVIHEDEHWMFFVAKYVRSIAFVKDITYNHYIVDGSIMRTGCYKKSIESVYNILVELSSSIDSILPLAQKKYIYNLMNSYLRIINSSNEYRKYCSWYRKLALSMLTSKKLNMNVLEILVLITLIAPNIPKMRGLTNRLICLC